jgi:cellulase/cellobiase CelA1
MTCVIHPSHRRPALSTIGPAVAGKAKGAGTAEGVQPVDVGAARLTAAAPLPSLEELMVRPSSAARASASSSPETLTPLPHGPTTATAR